jgi:hypothetical protein
MKKSGEHIRVNFGQSPFVFDIDGMMSVSNDSTSHLSTASPVSPVSPVSGSNVPGGSRHGLSVVVHYSAGRTRPQSPQSLGPGQAHILRQWNAHEQPRQAQEDALIWGFREMREVDLNRFAEFEHHANGI